MSGCTVTNNYELKEGNLQALHGYSILGTRARLSLYDRSWVSLLLRTQPLPTVGQALAPLTRGVGGGGSAHSLPTVSQGLGPLVRLNALVMYDLVSTIGFQIRNTIM